jgi:hypothetical protein
MKHRFKKDTQSGVIFVTVYLKNRYKLKMILDSGASGTTIDFTALCMAGYVFGQASQTTQVETANGIIDVNVFEIESLTALEHTVRNIPVQVYDFMAHGVLSDYDGMLGLDFFKDTVLTIDMINQTLEISPETQSNQIAALSGKVTALSEINAELLRLLQQSGIPIPPNLN